MTPVFGFLKPTRKKPRNGDVFAAQLADRRYLFGRVIGADLPRQKAPMPGAYLIYMYGDPFDDKTPDRAVMTPENLLIPPAFINRLPWTKGYFETVDHWRLTPDDLLSRHCFQDLNGTFVDESGAKLSGPVHPCGEWGLASYRLLDDRVSDALGMPRAPE